MVNLCPICHTTPATTVWHQVPICTPCRQDQRIVDRRLNWILLGLTLIMAVCIMIIVTS